MLEIDLFEKIKDNDVLNLLSCIGIKTKKYKQGQSVIKSGQKTDCLIIILSGCCNVSKTDIFGDEEDLYKLKTNDIFGQDYVCLGNNTATMNLTALTNAEVLFLPYEKLITPCEKLCPAHLKLIKNLLKMISKQNMTLNSKIDIVGQKSIREKVKTFLKGCSKEAGNNEFDIPYNRRQMSVFLSTNRSALSRELCSMMSDGLIFFKKNHFKIFF